MTRRTVAEVPLFVVDATVAVKWHLRDEEFVDEADDVKRDHLDSRGQLVATQPYLRRSWQRYP